MAINKKQCDIVSTPKNTLQGAGRNTKYAKTSRNGAKKPYKGQGK